MKPARIILDVTRSLLRKQNSTPTGIDRVEHAFIRRLLCLNKEYEVYFIAMTPYGAGVISQARMALLLNRIELQWANRGNKLSRPFRQLQNELSQPINTHAGRILRLSEVHKGSETARTYLDIFANSVIGRRRFIRMLRGASKNPTLYLHTSHIQLEKTTLFKWLRGKKIKVVFFIHDIIPIDYPEYCGVGASKKHRLRLRTVAKYGDAVIVNSSYTKDRLSAYFTGSGTGALPAVVSPLGIAASNRGSDDYGLSNVNVPYFVHASTMEGRKNIPFLLNIWHQLIIRHGANATPRLVLAGRRGWRCQNVFDVLDNSHQLAPNVIEVSDLKDAELWSLMEGATAVLAPSLVEGYGLPPAEALSRNVPVIASDIPAHSEVLGQHALLLDPTDGAGWQAAIISLAYDPIAQQEARNRIKGFRISTWDEHVDRALKDLSCIPLKDLKKPGANGGEQAGRDDEPIVGA